MAQVSDIEYCPGPIDCYDHPFAHFRVNMTAVLLAFCSHVLPRTSDVGILSHKNVLAKFSDSSRYASRFSKSRVMLHQTLLCSLRTDESDGVTVGEVSPSNLEDPQRKPEQSMESFDSLAVRLVDRDPLEPRVLFGEFLSTFLFVYISVTNASTSASMPAAGASNGAVIASVAAAFMPVSGAHLNPAVTVALALTRRMPVIRAVLFLPIQLVASVCATYAAAAAGAAVSTTFAGIPANPNSAQVLNAVCAEFVPMFFIVCILFQTAVATPEEGGVGMQLAALYIGLAVFACASTFPGIFNPARAFGPAFFLSVWNHHWIYWVPLPAAMIASLMCEHLFVAPSVRRPPKSWLAELWKRLDILSSRLRNLGAGALVAYGFMNVLYYLPVFTFLWFRVRFFNSFSGQLKSTAIFTLSMIICKNRFERDTLTLYFPSFGLFLDSFDALLFDHFNLLLGRRIQCRTTRNCESLGSRLGWISDHKAFPSNREYNYCSAL